jgi:SNF2 family DNA or RNA helicase
MVRREFSITKPHGGLCADSMGMGKTVQVLSTMVGNPPQPADIKANRKTTLIVLPSSLINQWWEEIQKHVEPGLFPRVLRYKLSKELAKIQLQDCDIVVSDISIFESFTDFQNRLHRMPRLCKAILIQPKRR